LETNPASFMLQSIHHTAIICSDYLASKTFYTEVLGLTVRSEHYRPERKSWKLDLCLNNEYVIELFSFPNAPKRKSKPEACGLRHLAFMVKDIEAATKDLVRKGVSPESIRVDEYTGKRFTFFADPDELPIELYEL
jgi:glyoxylase I family protein